MTTTVVLLNGPPRCGKDTVAKIAVDEVRTMLSKPVGIRRMAHPLKEAVHAMFGLQPDSEQLEYTKDVPEDRLLGHVPREEYISLSESYMKPRYGKDIFGRVFVNYLKELEERRKGSPQFHSPTIFVPDSGFTEEAIPIVEHLGPTNVKLIRIHRKGTDFSNDSRSYIDLDGVLTFDLTNDGTIDELTEDVRKLLKLI